MSAARSGAGALSTSVGKLKWVSLRTATAAPKDWSDCGLEKVWITAPDVPSMLVELGYLSNPEDEALLHSAGYQAKLGQAIVAAVDAYFGTRQTLLQP